MTRNKSPKEGDSHELGEENDFVLSLPLERHGVGVEQTVRSLLDLKIRSSHFKSSTPKSNPLHQQRTHPFGPLWTRIRTIIRSLNKPSPLPPLCKQSACLNLISHSLRSGLVSGGARSLPAVS